jgi:hypothetical protein
VRLFLLLVLTLPARADTSVTARATLGKCTLADSPYYRRMASGDRASDRAGRYRLTSSEKGTSLEDGVSMPVWIARSQARLVVDEAGELQGVLALPLDKDLNTVELYSPSGQRRWRSSLIAAHDAATLLSGKLLIVSLFHRMASGASLYALDAETGKQRWHADVVQLNVPHSKYFNDVTLEQHGDTVVMRGYEAGGCYRQTFELATGKRLTAEIR